MRCCIKPTGSQGCGFTNNEYCSTVSAAFADCMRHMPLNACTEQFTSSVTGWGWALSRAESWGKYSHFAGSCKLDSCRNQIAVTTLHHTIIPGNPPLPTRSLCPCALAHLQKLSRYWHYCRWRDRENRHPNHHLLCTGSLGCHWGIPVSPACMLH